MANVKATNKPKRRSQSLLFTFAFCDLPFGFSFLAPSEEEGGQGLFTFAICDLPFDLFFSLLRTKAGPHL